MGFNYWVRQVHRWLSIVFTVAVIINLVALFTKSQAVWIGLLALFPLILMLIATMVLGCAFLGIKAFEYYTEFAEHHVPGPGFQFEAEHFRHAQIFFSLYFVMTGIHALHMVIGLGIMSVMLWWAWRGTITTEYCNPIEISGLYWHFVDIVWIFLFPLLYLIGRHAGS